MPGARSQEFHSLRHLCCCGDVTIKLILFYFDLLERNLDFVNLCVHIITYLEINLLNATHLWKELMNVVLFIM